jgi:hypothetical protein
LNNDIAIIIQEGELKGKRLYDESKFGVDSVFPSEMFFFYQNAVKNNYKIFKFNCEPNHSIIFSEKELDYLNIVTSQLLYDSKKKIILKSKNINKIKKYQLHDLNKIYSLAIENDSIGSIFTLTKNVNNSYCFDLILITKNNFNLNDFLKLEFNIIKIISVNEISKTSINFEEIKKLHDYLNSPFKDNFINYREAEKPNKLFNVSKECINYKKHCVLLNDFVLKKVSSLKELSCEEKNELIFLKNKKTILGEKMNDKQKEL